VIAFAGCRSAAPDLAPAAPPAPVAAAAEPKAVEEAPPELAEAEEETETPEGAGDLADEGPAPEDASAEDPQGVQKEAVELCQSAEDLLDQGAIDEAIGAVDRAYELMLSLPANGDDAYLQAKEDIRLLVADLITRIYHESRPAARASSSSWDLAMPVATNDHVQREIQSLTTVEREQFLAGYRRSGQYRPMILGKLEAAGLPSQLSWLPLVESWFKVRALSRASALGMWQFISSTGLRYGLGRDGWVDERLDPEKATDAAIAYLSELHGFFGDWAKALAAYNCGEARVMRLQRRSDEYLDFWDLYEQLPGETRRYVPRLFAALLILEDPERYGLTLPEPDPPLGTTARIQLAKAVKLESVDDVLGLEKGTLADLNPELRHKATPSRAYDLRVPAGSEERVLASVDAMPEWKPPTPLYVTHRVRSGETLSVIASRYGTSVSAIMRSNHLRSANRIWPGQRLRIPVRGTGGARRTSYVPDAGGMHTVRNGESLSTIARRYGTTVSRLKAENGLRSSLIRPGQRLHIPRGH
jgi:membrane-bound lytic murein transglycosylase D